MITWHRVVLGMIGLVWGGWAAMGLMVVLDNVAPRYVSFVSIFLLAVPIGALVGCITGALLARGAMASAGPKLPLYEMAGFGLALAPWMMMEI